MSWIERVIRDQWPTWVQHFGLLALVVGLDFRLGLHPWLTAIVSLIMLGRETADVIRHRDAGHDPRLWVTDFLMDWNTVIFGIGFGAWMYG